MEAFRTKVRRLSRLELVVESLRLAARGLMENLARSIAKTENENAEPKTSKYLVQIAKEQRGLSAAEVGTALKERGINEFRSSRWIEMNLIVLEYASQKAAAPVP